MGYAAEEDYMAADAAWQGVLDADEQAAHNRFAPAGDEAARLRELVAELKAAVARLQASNADLRAALGQPDRDGGATK